MKSFALKGILEDASYGDTVVAQFNTFVADPSVQKQLQTYKDTVEAEKPRLDDLFYKMMNTKYPQLWTVVRKVLTLSHGNATVSFKLIMI